MTYPDAPFPDPRGDQAELCAAAAAGYDRYRPGVPTEAARLRAEHEANSPAGEPS
ncbi:hypothetical protein AB4Z54_02880 [Streptomyces sp. MCAF7]